MSSIERSPSLTIRSIRSTLSGHPEFDDHEDVLFCEDSHSGLRALIAIHSTKLGPSLGGCRMWKYESDEQAITDVLRLSKAMSYKHAIAETGRGGGKAVIIGDSASGKHPALLGAFGRFVDTCDGRYITAEDVGMSADDMLLVREETDHVSGLPFEIGGSGDPSPMTAYGVFCGIVAGLSWHQGREVVDVNDHRIVRHCTVSVQGLGQVGFDLCRQLRAAGAKIFVADVYPDRVQRACDEFSAVAVSPDQIISTEADVFAPCALGGILTGASISQLGARIVAGAANNQLATPHDGQLLFEQGILYAPDFVINAGGVINIANEQPGYDESRAKRQTEKIANNLWQIFVRSKKLNRATSDVAEQLARERLAAATPT